MNAQKERKTEYKRDHFAILRRKRGGEWIVRSYRYNALGMLHAKEATGSNSRTTLEELIAGKESSDDPDGDGQANAKARLTTYVYDLTQPYYEVLTEGKGAIPADTCRVSVNYEGKLLNDTIFDSSYQRGEPAKFMVKQVIPGWQKALTNMPVGSTWMVYIPQEQAYGERDGGKIPPFSCLIFKIEMLGIEK